MRIIYASVTLASACNIIHLTKKHTMNLSVAIETVKINKAHL